MTRSDKIRVSQHSGREGSARHNDRTFMDGKSHTWIAEHADHIDTARTDENHYMTWNNDPDFEKSERDYYHQAYTAGQDAVNARYVKSGHPERCKTVDDLYTGKLTRPEEMILQIGDRNSGIDGDTFTHAVCDYMDRVLAWSAEHGNPMRLLNVAIHLDEGSPHAHIRRVWEYRDKDGLARLGQNKALEAAGIEPPRPGEKLGRYNNRKMTFDSMARGVWQEVCREYGFEIETEPRPDMRHKSKQDYVRDQMTAEIDTLRQEKEKEPSDAPTPNSSNKPITNDKIITSNQTAVKKPRNGKSRKPRDWSTYPDDLPGQMNMSDYAAIPSDVNDPGLPFNQA
jgi:hypothetical protein